MNSNEQNIPNVDTQSMEVVATSDEQQSIEHPEIITCPSTIRQIILSKKSKSNKKSNKIPGRRQIHTQNPKNFNQKNNELHIKYKKFMQQRKHYISSDSDNDEILSKYTNTTGTCDSYDSIKDRRNTRTPTMIDADCDGHHITL